MQEIFLFCFSVGLAISSIYSFLLFFSLKKKDIFFTFFPSLFIYLGFISTFLSFFSALNWLSFLLVQVVCFVPAGRYFLKKLLSFHHLNPKKIRKYFPYQPFNFLTVMMCLCIFFFLLSSLVLRTHTSLLDFDDNQYRASTPLYWVQNQSIFRFQTANQRKNIFILGSGLIYLWPNLFHLPQESGNLVYWLAFPLTSIAIYLLAGDFTKQRELKLLNVFVLISSPIFFYFSTYTLIQESWLGLILISFIYFLITDIRTSKQKKSASFWVGTSLAVAVFIKITGIYYMPALLIYFLIKENRLKRILCVSAGFLLGLFLSGTVVLTIQNIQLYGSFLGTKEFYQAHEAHFSELQITTHLKRLPFLFLDFPLFSSSLTHIAQQKINALAQTMGASATLPEEDTAWWWGKYTYRLTYPNTVYSVNGIIWVSLIFYCFILCVRKIRKREFIPKEYVIFILISGAWVVEVLTIRWAEGANLPYRHLLSAFCLGISFFCLFFPKKYSRLTLAFVFIFFVISGLPPLLKELGKLQNIDKNYSAPMQEAYYPSFLDTIQQPISYLLVEEQNTRDYPFFWLHSQQLNRVYLFNPVHRDGPVFISEIISEGSRTGATYIVVPHLSQQNSNLLIQESGGKIAFVAKSITSNFAFDLFKRDVRSP